VSERPVIVAGAGPVGVLLALALARQGIPVRVFEAEARVNDMPRASTLHPATLEMLGALDLFEEVKARGLVAYTFQFWDRPTNRVVAEFDHQILKNDTAYPLVIQCEQHKVDDRVEVTIEGANGSERITGSYLVGADGGRSTVRKALDIGFEGYTFPERFMVLTTAFDFAAERGAAFRAYFSDPDEWANLFKVAGDGSGPLWRVVFPTIAGQTDEEVLNEAAVQGRLQKFFPKTGDYPVVHRNLYNVHQRVAASFSKGRVFLAGDSAHVNNPIGGLGLNCGIHDAMELQDLLGGVIRGSRPEADLVLYDQRRRPINIESVQQQTIANKKRLEEKEPAQREANFEFLRKTAADPAAHRAFLLRTSLLESVRKNAAA
jgi:3-(3-hydroxy-phenyl)propionate hydroxylase